MNTFDRIEFDQQDVANVLAKLTTEEIDELPFGAIELDRDGVVLSFNAREAKESGRKAESVIGKRFFVDVAPCAKTPEFYGRFETLVAGGPSAVFDYVFDYEMAPRKVRVHMKKALLGDTYWVLIRWLGAART